MKRRWRLWLGLVLFFLMVGSLFQPTVHWRLIGWIKGEAFYEGRPTRWWVNEIEAHYIAIVETFLSVRDFPIVEPIPEPELVGWSREASPSWWDWLPTWFASNPSQATFIWTIGDTPALVNGDPDALPVLLELIRRPELKARQVAVSGLAASKSREPAVIAALSEAIWDSDPAIRKQAERALRGKIAEDLPPPAVDNGP